MSLYVLCTTPITGTCTASIGTTGLAIAEWTFHCGKSMILINPLSSLTSWWPCGRLNTSVALQMPWKCPSCSIQREPAGSFLADKLEYCTAGLPFSPFNNMECCGCRGFTGNNVCGCCSQRQRGVSGASEAHKEKVLCLDLGLCVCGRTRGHARDPQCLFVGTAAGIRKPGEGEAPIHRPPFSNGCAPKRKSFAKPLPESLPLFRRTSSARWLLGDPPH